MSVGRDIDNTLAEMSVLANAPAAKPLDAPFIKGGKASSGAPRDFGDDLHSEWSEKFQRLAEAARIALKRAQGDRAYKARGSQSKEDRDKRILQFHEGDDARFVAYVENLSEDHIRKVRREHDRLPHNGRLRG
jgi:hypothetical protein